MEKSNTIQKIKELLNDSNFKKSIEYLESCIEADPEQVIYYWYLGLAYLLEEKETEAQTTWLLVMSQGDELEIEKWTKELVDILESEAQHQEELENLKLSWLIRGHMREIKPDLISNLLTLINLEISLDYYEPNHLECWGLVQIIENQQISHIEYELLINILPKILSKPVYINLELLNVLVNKVLDKSKMVDVLEKVSIDMAYNKNLVNYAIELSKIALKIDPDDINIIDRIFWFALLAKNYDLMLEASETFDKKIDGQENLQLKAFSLYKKMNAYLHGGLWSKAEEISVDYISYLHKFSQEKTLLINPLVRGSLYNISCLLLYLQDKPRLSRTLTNKLSLKFYEYLPQWMAWTPKKKIKPSSSKIKIGYIGHTLRRHSVGWLSRWLIHYHNRDQFDITIYLINQVEDDITTKWFCNQANKIYNFPHFPQKIAEQIYEDQIDILIDLDSFSNNVTTQVMCLKPAPIQVTWLGFDASGLPSIDYFIADPFVLPAIAEEYYQENIWRLPQTYLAVDGFEVGTPTISRQSMGIEDDAIVYMTVQAGIKRHPACIHLQMQILQSVPKSYLLIKGKANIPKIKFLFSEIAKEYNISPDRLHFLDISPSEEIHRANLSIADVILDTYPYNGATTTLEALWMEIPLVTRVGKQFAARNSYTFMVNAGIAEGIAWTDEEYVKWGIRLGKELSLRKKIHWKLRQSKKNAPLWNAKNFTVEMERAYCKMWANYLDSQE